MATQRDYDTGTAALTAYALQLVKTIGVPEMFRPSQDTINKYAAEGAKDVIDAVDSDRAAASPTKE